MATFKIGEKVVFIGLPSGKDEMCVAPPLNSIVTLKDSKYFDRWNLTGWVVQGFETALNGNPQFFQSEAFRKIDYGFAERVLADIKEEQLIEIL